MCSEISDIIMLLGEFLADFFVANLFTDYCTIMGIKDNWASDMHLTHRVGNKLFAKTLF